MLALGTLLSLLIGLALGVLGGGGSILAVPILRYVFGLEAKPAIATSLLVVGVTSVVGVLQHARVGNVRWRTGFLFAAFTMFGAYAGGRVAAHVPDAVLFALFAGAMVVTGIAMLRGRPTGPTAVARRGAAWRIAAQGLGVGALTGLVGAGGGFLIVPALATLGGLPMHAAVGTSLLVISLGTATGLAGHLSHMTLDARIALLATGAAGLGALLGGRLAPAISAAGLRRAFGVLVLGMAGVVLVRELPRELLGDPTAAALLGGVLIGTAAAGLLVGVGRIAGISGIVGGLLHPSRGEAPWRLAFVAGLVVGGRVLLAVRPASLAAGPSAPLAMLACAGLLVGIGARVAGGCTSGHGVCGVGRGSPRSLAATATFLATGMAAVFLVHHVLGGSR